MVLFDVESKGKMKSYSYLTKDGNTYYFRIKIPKSLHNTLITRQIKKSLYTKELKVAEYRAKILFEYISVLFKKAEENMLSEEQIKSLVNEYVNQKLKNNEDCFLDIDVVDVIHSQTEIEDLCKNILQTKAMLKNYLAINNLDAGNEFTRWLSETHNISPEDDKEKNKLKREFLKAMVLSYDIFYHRAKGDYDNSFDNVELVNTDTSPQNMQKESIPWLEQDINSNLNTEKRQQLPERNIGTLLADFHKEKSTSGNWRLNTETDKKAHFNVFLEHFTSETNVNEINRNMILNYRENILKKLPHNRNKNPQTSGLSLQEQINFTGMKTISERTINQYIITINSFFQWCEDNEYISKNPVGGLTLKIHSTPTDERKKYSTPEIKKIVKGIAKFKIVGKIGIKNIDRKWIILIALYQGMRQNEICQLMLSDIVREQNNIACISISDAENQSIKTTSSRRLLPIHKVLLQLGFIDFVIKRRKTCHKIQRSKKTEEEKKQQKHLFQTMTYNEAKSSYTKNFQVFYGGTPGFNKKYITRDPKKTFHSLRHNFSSILENTSNIPYAVSYLTGHSLGTETANRYTKPNMQTLSIELARLNYNVDIFDLLGVEPLSDEKINEQIESLPQIDTD